MSYESATRQVAQCERGRGRRGQWQVSEAWFPLLYPGALLSLEIFTIMKIYPEVLKIL